MTAFLEFANPAEIILAQGSAAMAAHPDLIVGFRQRVIQFSLGGKRP